MARYRQRRRRSAPRPKPNLWLIVAQILLLIGLLVALIAFRDRIGDSAGFLVDSISSDDISVQDNPAISPPEL